jgi:M6 family metalloprotease-like protein
MRRLGDRAAAGLGEPMRTLIKSLPGSASLALIVGLSSGALSAPSVAAAGPAGNADACRLPALVEGWLNEGIPTDYGVFLEPEGTLRAVMLFVDFPDAPIADVDPAWDEVGEYLEIHQAGADWLRSVSYGDVDLEITAVDQWYRMSQPSPAYGLDRAVTFDQHVAYIAEAVALADAHVDFREYDLVYVVAAPNATGISNSPAYIDASDSRIVADGVVISHGATFGTDVWLWPVADRPLVLAHETAHVFGLPDVYSFSGDAHRFVGGWDVMDDLSSAAPGLFAWHRWKLGWISDRQVACLAEPGNYSVRLTAIDRHEETKLAVIPTGPSTAFVLESRRAIGLDADACSTGVLAYRVDSSVVSGSGPIRVIDATPGDAGSGTCGDLAIATFGTPSRPSTFADAAADVTLDVVRQSRFSDVIIVGVEG